MGSVLQEITSPTQASSMVDLFSDTTKVDNSATVSAVVVAVEEAASFNSQHGITAEANPAEAVAAAVAVANPAEVTPTTTAVG
jgi:hypothetical protein